MQQGRAPAAVKSPAAIQARRRRLAVGNQNDLPVTGPVRSEKLTGEPQRLCDVGAVLHEIGKRYDGGEILRSNQLGVGAEGDQLQRDLGLLGLNEPVKVQSDFLDGLERGVLYPLSVD